MLAVLDITELERAEKLLRHIQNVQRGCIQVGLKLIKTGKADLGRQLIANGMIHDHTKWYGMEWKYLNGDSSAYNLNIALAIHQSKNMHHPEYWSGIHRMPDVYLYECVVDWWARSAELGSDLRNWIQTTAARKFGFQNDNDQVRAKIDYILDLLLEPGL